ncbi:MAG: hypothetical protein BMS9Abin26_1199 [Gammaproteobacteria bacterium]|nr:MAG: hypothetical protein BMS9Abin26_1199 [Gammaproteobacteria bacterium]
MSGKEATHLSTGFANNSEAMNSTQRPADYQPVPHRRLVTLPVYTLLGIFILLGLQLFFNLPALPLDQGHYYLLGLTFSGLALAIYVLIQIRTRIFRPLDELNQWSRRIRTGDLHTPIPERPEGEFRDLVSDINILTHELNALTEEMDAKVRVQTEHIADKSRSLEILYDITTSLSEAHTLDELLEQFLDTLMTLVDAKAASVRLLTDNNKTNMVASRGFSQQVVDQETSVDISRCLCGKIAQQGGLGIQKGVDSCNQFLDCQIVDGNCSELVVVPLQYRDRILGVYNILLQQPSSELGKDARDMLSSIGKHLGLALEKAQLDEKTRRLAVMEERNMLGNELHDSLAQSLVSMRLQIKMLGELLHQKDIRSAQNEVRNLRSAIDEAHTSLRELLANFRFRMDERGLLFSIEDLMQRFSQETNINTYLQNKCEDSKFTITPNNEVQIFRILQEAFSNIRKHSKASNVRVLLSQDDISCNILIEDDGLGIDLPNDSSHPGEHIGVSIMQERAGRLNGTLTIESEPGEGTRVQLSFPRSP